MKSQADGEENFSKNKIIRAFQSYSSKVNWLVFLLVVFISVGGWLEIYGN